MDPGAVLLALLGSANLASRRAGVRAVRLDRPGEHRRRTRPRRRGRSGSRARRRRSSPRPTRNQAVGALDPWLGAALSVAEATRNVAITGARPLGRHELPELRRPDPARGVLAAVARRSAAWATRAARSGLPVTGGNVSLYNESPAGAIAPTPEIGVVGPARRRRDARRPGVPRRPATGSLLVGEATPGPRRQRVRARSPGWRAEDGPPDARPRARAAAPGVRPRGGRARARSRRPRTSRAAASRSRSPSARSGATRRGLGARLRLAVAQLAGGRAVRREPVAGRRLGARRATSRRSSCSPASTACRRGARRGRRRRGSVDRARRRRRRDRRRRGARQPRRRRARRPARRAAPRLGARPAARARLGRDAARPLMCGVFGVVLRARQRAPEAAALAALGLFALQHRGQESAGVAVSDGEQLMLYKDLGLIASVLDERRLPSLQGDLAIAHCRYSTTGSTVWENAQPTFRLGPRRALAIGHNGNLVNTRELLDQLAGGRGRLPATTDTELLTALLADEPAADTVDALRARPAARPRRVQPRGPRRAAGHRRPRPVRLPAARPRPAAGRADARRRTRAAGLWGDEHRRAGSSPRETAGARHRRRRVRPRRRARRDRRPRGRAGRRARSASPTATPALCVFELIYFARPDSYMEGRNLYEARRRMGEELAREHPADADLVMPVPDTGAPAAAGLRRGVGHPVPRGHGPQPLHRPDVHPAEPGDAPARRDDEAQPAARGRPRASA